MASEGDQDVPAVSPSFDAALDENAGVEDDALLDPSTSTNALRRDDASCVQVAVRVRPIITLEGDDENCIQVLHHQGRSNSNANHATAIQIGGSSGPRFTFDQVFGTKSTQEDVYATRVAPLVISCLEGYNATILAYGQTGSGKTYTIMGPDPAVAAASPLDSYVGVIPRAFAAIFQSLAEKKEAQREIGIDLEYQVSVQFLELYGEEIRDLLTTHRNTSSSSSGGSNGNDKLFIRDLGTDEPEVVGATQMPVSSASQALRCLAHGMLRRVTGATAMNESSSRSHAILTVCIEQSCTVVANNARSSVNSKTITSSSSSLEGSDDCDDLNDDHVQMTRSKFNFVDLAGAERQKRTGASGKRLQEGIDINKGLSNLGNVISALGDPKKRGKTHVPYRDAKLTRLLKGSLGGNHKTLMIACVSPAALNMGESLNCLRYANRAKNIQNKAVVNVDANSRLVQELQGQVRALATDLLRALDGEPDAVQFERAILVSLANGSAGAVPMSPTPSKSLPAGRSGGDVSEGLALRLRETESELQQTRHKLRQAQSYQDAAELELHTVRAQNQLCDLQITALTRASDGGDGMAVDDAMKTAFLEKAAAYENEIGVLQNALRAAESKLNTSEWNFDNNEEENKVNEWLEQEEQALHRDQDRLASIRALSFEDNETQYHTACDAEMSHASGRRQDTFEADEENEQAVVDALTKKYVNFDGCHDEDDTENDAPELESPPARLSRVRKVAADLEELSQSIAMKEKLIEQIKRNKEREAMMRTFYENKLEALRRDLEDKEKERDDLLKVASKQSVVSEELKDQLREKEEQIAALKLKQKSFTAQSAKAPRSEADRELQLKGEISKMKKRKADMQKELAHEKRHHLRAVSSLNKIVVQRDREINRVQRIANQRAADAELAKAMAKTRLTELTQLKKALRLYKQGVGLDPVIVGRRQVRAKGRSYADHSAAVPSIDVDSIRDYFDEKVACVVRKEVLVDKLVKEWEEYFELHTRLKEFLNQTVDHSASDLETLEVQIRYKNDRIRKLARRVHKQDIPTHSTDSPDETNQGDVFLLDENFSKLCSGFSSTLAQNTATKILFGMIVRERRRVAALAKAASSLDERVQTTEKQLAFSESALRSYMDDHRQEVANLEEKQHKHILTLINMVNDDANQGDQTSGDPDGSDFALSEVKYQKMLLVLANERVSVLEDQLSEMNAQRSAGEEYMEKIDQLNTLLATKSEECDWLEQARRELRTGMRKIRDEVSNHQATGTMPTPVNILDLVETYLHGLSEGPTDAEQSASPRQKPLRHTLSPRFKMHVELMNSSDSDSESEVEQPDDSKETIARLTHIVTGVSGMSNSSSVLQDGSRPAEGSVFDRLANPQSFTGTQRQKNKNGSPETGVRHGAESSTSAKDSLRPSSGSGTHHFAMKPTTYDNTETTSSDNQIGTASTSGPAAYQSVFDRLGSPSQYTGTQKERFHDSRTKRDRGLDTAPDKPSGTGTAPKETSGHTDEKFGHATIRAEYAKLNVFDRLQNTTTQAAAIRQNETIHQNEIMHGDPRVEVKVSHNTGIPGVDGLYAPDGMRGSPGSESAMNDQSALENGGEKRHGMDRAAYVKQNVFDRLQTTTTLAAAVRQSETLHHEVRAHAEVRPQISPVAVDDSAAAHSKKVDIQRSAPLNSSGRADYRKQNVFERLNKTTTETFAKKTHKTKSDDSVAGA